MTFTIYEAYDNDRLIVKCGHGTKSMEYATDKKDLYDCLRSIAEFVNNDLGKECLFEVE